MLFARLSFIVLLAGGASALAQGTEGEVRASGPPQPPEDIEATDSLENGAAPIETTELESLVVGAERLASPASPSQNAPSAPLPVERDTRRLAAPSTQGTPTADKPRPRLVNLDLDGLPVDPVSTGAALVMVVGLFLLTVTAFKRAAPKSQRVLPSEVAAVLGRVPLGGKQMAHLLKMGNKLVLVHITSDEVKALTEISDPAEVTQLLALCEQEADHSATTAFRDVFDKLASQPSAPGFLDESTPLIDRQKLADAYANTPGGRSIG